MRLRPLLLLFLLFALLAPPASAKDVPLPAPQAGDFWAYDVGGAQTGNLTVRYHGEESVMVGATDTPAFRFDWTNGGGIPGGQTNWYRKTDFAKLRVDQRDSLGLTTSYTLDEPCAEWQFPLTVGKSWNTTCTFHALGQQDLVIPSTWQVLRAETVTVPAGTFDAVVLEQNDTSAGYRSQWWFAASACLYVKEQDLDPAGAVTHTETLTSYHCGAATPTPSPTPTPSASATPTATPTASATPVATATLTLTATPTSSATASPSASASPSTTPPITRAPGPGLVLVGAGLAGGALLARKRI